MTLEYKHFSQLLLAGIFLFMIFSNFILSEPRVVGEWDDYLLVTASIMNDGNVTISQDDVHRAKEIFPEFEEYINQYHLSGYYSRQGDELAWYFPIYSALCVPVVLLLRVFHLPCTNAFLIINIMLYQGALIFAYKKSTFTEKTKFYMLLALCVNPAIIYTEWISGETFLFAFLLASVICWVEGAYTFAGILLSIASMLNPAVLGAGIVMVLTHIFSVHNREKLKMLFSFLPALLPFAFSLYHTGYINLTAVTDTDVSVTRIIQRFWAYLWDLNLGFFPYYGILFLIFLFVFAISIIKGYWKVLTMGLSFFAVCAVYSIEVHINCGMSGIARYSAWTGGILVVAVFLFVDNFCEGKAQGAYYAGEILSALWTGMIMVSILLSHPMRYLEFTPLAKIVLDKAPALYDPLPDIFNARTNHVDETTYVQNLPIIYTTDSGQVRKILCRQEDMDAVLLQINGSEENLTWLKESIGSIQSKPKYISVGKGRELSVDAD